MSNVLVKNAGGFFEVCNESDTPAGAAVVFSNKASMNPLNRITLANNYAIHIHNPRHLTEFFKKNPLLKIEKYDDCCIEVFLLEERIERIPMTGIDFETIQLWCNVCNNLTPEELIRNLTALVNQLKEKITEQNEDIASCKGLCFGIVNNTLSAEEALERVFQLNDSLRIHI